VFGQENLFQHFGHASWKDYYRLCESAAAKEHIQWTPCEMTNFYAAFDICQTRCDSPSFKYDLTFWGALVLYIYRFFYRYNISELWKIRHTFTEVFDIVLVRLKLHGLLLDHMLFWIIRSGLKYVSNCKKQ
jgi:hypothetical protein